MQLYLDTDRIGLEIDQPAGSDVLGEWERAAMEVDQQLGGSIQGLQFRVGETEVPVVSVDRVVRPSSREAETVHHAREESGRPGPAVVLASNHEHGWRAGVFLNVVCLEAQSLEAEQVVQRLPDHAGYRHL